ncbi:MAG: hypothetical protein ACRED4_06770, partial [Brevundimonas sp.]
YRAILENARRLRSALNLAGRFPIITSADRTSVHGQDTRPSMRAKGGDCGAYFSKAPRNAETVSSPAAPAGVVMARLDATDFPRWTRATRLR